LLSSSARVCLSLCGGYSSSIHRHCSCKHTSG
jgi:hypothetical protein